MGIWVKSQDGGLGKYNKFLPPVIRYKEMPDPDGTPFPVTTDEVIHARIMGCDSIGNLDIVGEYPTKGEALIVLDMIEKHYFHLHKYSMFQMPVAGFSKEDQNA